MATHSNIPVWRIPWTEEPGGLQSFGSQRVRHNRSDLARIYNSKGTEAPKCPLTGEWIKTMWYIYTMEFYSAIKRNEIGSFVETWIDLECVIQSEVRKEKQISYINALIWNPEKWYR